MKILLVEDDDRIADPTKEYLEDQHYVVDVAADGESAWALASNGLYDLILLDIMLPKLDGVSICRRLRQTDHAEPILIMTARGADREKVLGLDSGADDYLVKPFGLEELAARIRALLRRGTQKRHPVLTCGKLTLDPATCRVDYDGKPVDVTPTEYRLLSHFLRYPNAIFSREALIDRLWLQGDVPTEDVVRMHIMGLRTKLRYVGAPRDLIETAYGLGYRLANDAK
jgi:DNA-binding response OmpR family regulator